MPLPIPFKALLYSSRLRSEMQNLIAPPYDVISAEGLDRLRSKHEFNAVKLSLVDDEKDPDRYKKMKARFQNWKTKGVFEQDTEASFYLIEEIFEVGSQKAQRVGFVSLLETSPFSEKKILPHEHTLSGPKQDRLELLKEMGAELSQIFLCYRDSNLVLEKIYESKKKESPLFEIPSVDGVARKVWKLSDSKDQKKLEEMLRAQSVLIADGHHRYETSVHFRQVDGTTRSKYVQVYFTNLESPGFSIQPIHRIFSLPTSLSQEDFLKALKKNFEVEKVDRIDPERLLKLRDEKSVALFLQWEKQKGIPETLLLRRKQKSAEDAEIFVVQQEILEGILGWDLNSLAKGTVRYEHELREFEKTRASLDRGVGLFLPPTDLDLVMKRALRGERMPQKSTYFYPKIASGLINYELGQI